MDALTSPALIGLWLIVIGLAAFMVTHHRKPRRGRHRVRKAGAR